MNSRKPDAKHATYSSYAPYVAATVGWLLWWLVWVFANFFGFGLGFAFARAIGLFVGGDVLEHLGRIVDLCSLYRLRGLHGL